VRERGDDLPRLVHYFLRRASREYGLGVREVSPDALKRLTAYGWPGNVRELQNVITQAAVLSDGDSIAQEHLPRRLWGQEGAEREETLGQAFGHTGNGRDRLEATVGRVRSSPTNGSDSFGAPPGIRYPVGMSLADIEKSYVLKSIEHLGTTRTETARILGISRKTLYDKLKRWSAETR